MLFNIGTATSECGVESLISSIGSTNKKGRPLSLPQLHKELMIKVNGPKPLHKDTEKFLRDSLYKHFGGGPEKWTFCKGSSQTCPEQSKVVSRHINSTSESKLP